MVSEKIKILYVIFLPSLVPIDPAWFRRRLKYVIFIPSLVPIEPAWFRRRLKYVIFIPSLVPIDTAWFRRRLKYEKLRRRLQVQNEGNSSPTNNRSESD